MLHQIELTPETINWARNSFLDSSLPLGPQRNFYHWYCCLSIWWLIQRFTNGQHTENGVYHNSLIPSLGYHHGRRCRKSVRIRGSGNLQRHSVCWKWPGYCINEVIAASIVWTSMKKYQTSQNSSTDMGEPMKSHT